MSTASDQAAMAYAIAIAQRATLETAYQQLAPEARAKATGELFRKTTTSLATGATLWESLGGRNCDWIGQATQVTNGLIAAHQAKAMTGSSLVATVTQTLADLIEGACGCQGLGCDTCCPPPDLRPEYDPHRPCPDCGHECCCDEIAASAAEIRAEFAMSWVMGGGHPDDASAAARQHGVG